MSWIETVRRRLSRRVAIVAVLVALIVPATAMASHFTDVAPSNIFYNNINNIAGAGITSGCTATTYCPTQAVTREQMAAFLNRTGPRLSIAYFAHPLGNTPGQQPPTNSVVASTPIEVRGSAALMIETSFYTITYAGSGTFPCETLYRFRIDNTIVGNPLMYHREIVVPANTWLTQPLTGQYAIVVPEGEYTVSLIYQRVTNSCSMYPGNGVLTVEPIPFRWDFGTYGFGAPAPGAASDGEVEMYTPNAGALPVFQSNGERAG